MPEASELVFFHVSELVAEEARSPAPSASQEQAESSSAVPDTAQGASGQAPSEEQPSNHVSSAQADEASKVRL